MTQNEAFLRDYLEDARAAQAVFEQMTTRELLGLRKAFALDMADAVTPGGLAFCAGRRALVEAVLARRGDTVQGIAG